jgi:hypothetical protein
MPDFKRARRQGPLVVENAQVRGGSLQVEVSMGVATALRPPEEPADFEMPSALDSRTPHVESTAGEPIKSHLLKLVVIQLRPVRFPVVDYDQRYDRRYDPGRNDGPLRPL